MESTLKYSYSSSVQSMKMLKCHVVSDSGGKSNPHPTETISAASPRIDKLDMPPAKRPRIEVRSFEIIKNCFLFYFRIH
jgi:hypothetical protein